MNRKDACRILGILEERLELQKVEENYRYTLNKIENSNKDNSEYVIMLKEAYSLLKQELQEGTKEEEKPQGKIEKLRDDLLEPNQEKRVISFSEYKDKKKEKDFQKNVQGLSQMLNNRSRLPHDKGDER